MVVNSDKTYGEHMEKARTITDRQEVGETLEALLKQLKSMIEESVNQQAEICMKKGFNLPKYYIWYRFRKEPYANNTIHIYPMHRTTRPSPYQDKDHILWSVTNLNEVKYEWNVMSDEVTNYVLANKPKFHDQTVQMAQAYKQDKLEKLSDYIVGGAIA